MTARPVLPHALPNGKGEPVPEGQRNASLWRACSRCAREGSIATRSAAIMAGERRAVRPTLDPAEVKAIVEARASTAGLLIRGPREDRARETARAEGLSPAAPKNETGDWRADLFTTPKGAVRNTFANICAILRNAEEYGERLRYNEMLIAPTLDGHAMQEAELGLMREAIERRYGFSPGADSLAQAMSRLRGSGGITPSATTSLELQWDGTGRLDALCASVLHAEPSPINRTMVRACPSSAVARAMDPVQVTPAMVPVGEQAA